MAEVNLETGVPSEWTSVIDLTSEAGGRLMLTVAGEIDIANAPRLHELLTKAFQGTVDEVVVDLRTVTFIDSTALGVLVNARQRARSTGCSLKLVLPEGQARFPFEVTGLATLFDKHEPEDAEEPTENVG